MMRVDPQNHLLMVHDAPVPYRPASDQGGVMAGPPALIVVHYSAGSSFEGDVGMLTRRDKAYVSAHLVIGRDGEMSQLVPFNRVAWHAGRSEWPRGDAAYRDLNKCAIGIEFSNAGRLEKRADGAFVAWFGAEIPAHQVQTTRIQGVDSHWHRFTDVQLMAGIQACRALVAAYGVHAIVGHADICLPAGRKVDPGPAFPMTTVRRQVFAAPPPPKPPPKPSVLITEPPRRRSWLARFLSWLKGD